MDSGKYGVFSAEKMVYPMVLRVWQAGDYFVPLGMNKRKKVADFLSDLKVSVLEKKNVYVLEDATSNIIWVVGYRISDMVKITASSERVEVYALE